MVLVVPVVAMAGTVAVIPAVGVVAVVPTVNVVTVVGTVAVVGVVTVVGDDEDESPGLMTVQSNQTITSTTAVTMR